MRRNMKYVVAVALLAVLAVVFGLAGTVAPVSELVSSEESSSSDSFTQFASTQATYDSGWVDIQNKTGQYITLNHELNTTDVVIDITGKQSLDPEGGARAWSGTYGGASNDDARSVIQTVDGGYALAGSTWSYGAGGDDFWLVKVNPVVHRLTGIHRVLGYSRRYGGTGMDEAHSMVQTSDGGYALAGEYSGFNVPVFWLVKTDSNGKWQWDQTYTHVWGGDGSAESVVQTGDGGYAVAGQTFYAISDSHEFWLVKTDSAGTMQWNQTYGGSDRDGAYSLVETSDGGYAMAGYTSFCGQPPIPCAVGAYDFWLVKTDVETGLAMTGLANHNIILHRSKNDPYWNYVRVRMWLIKDPTWQYGDINQDGIVDATDLFILSQNYGKTFSLLSLTGIAFIAGIHTYKKRKQQK